MGGNSVKSCDGAKSPNPTRRELMKAVGAATFGLFVPVASAHDEAPPAPSSRASNESPNQPWWMGPQYPMARVVEVRSSRVLRGAVVDPHALGSMLDAGVQSLTRAARPEPAWRSILGPAERIAIKLNSVGASVIGTNDAFARTLVGRLSAAGYDPGKIALIEASPALTRQLGTRTPPKGWGKSIELNGRPEPLANWFLESDAVINVPLLKTHQIAGMSCSMKNISHAIIRRPANYHENGCSPFVGQIISQAIVRNRLRIQIVNALRAVVDGGPEANPENVVAGGPVILGFDPVATDHVGRWNLELLRREKGLSPDVECAYLRAAADAGFGRWRPSEIERVAFTIDGA